MTDTQKPKSAMRQACELAGMLVGVVAKGFLFGCGLLLALAAFGFPA